MSQTETMKAYLIPWGIPVWSRDVGQIAVWQSDDITILRRVGSHFFCLVEYGAGGYREQFTTWIHKRLLRRRRACGID